MFSRTLSKKLSIKNKNNGIAHLLSLSLYLSVVINFLSDQGLGGAWELAIAKARLMARADCLFAN